MARPRAEHLEPGAKGDVGALSIWSDIHLGAAGHPRKSSPGPAS